MRFGFISREYPPQTHVGGIGTYTAAAAQLLAGAGHEVHVICNGITASKQVEAGVIVHRIVMGNHPLPQGNWAFLWRKFVRKNLPTWLDATTWAHTVAVYVAQSQVLQGLQVVEHPETNGEAALIHFQRDAPSAKVIGRIHTSWLESNMHHALERILLLRLQRLACHKSHTLVSPSRAISEDYVRNTLRIKTPITVDPNPFIPWPNPIAWDKKSSQHFLFVGRIEHRKGIDLVVDALRQFTRTETAIEIRVIGAMHEPYSPVDVEVQNQFKAALLEFSGSQSSVHRLQWMGPLPHSQLAEHYDWAGIVLFPSRMDNYPYVLLEAMSRGCFILGTDVGGVAEIVRPPKFGELISTAKSEMLVEKMRKWIGQDAALQPHWHRAVEATSHRFSKDAMLQRMMKIYAGECLDHAKDLSQDQTPY